MREFDESEAIAAMRAALEDNGSITYDDDELLNLVDIIWDFYEQNGMLDIDLDDDCEEDDYIPDLIDYARRMIKKDKNAHLSPDDIERLVLAEIAYEESLSSDMF